jgi:hypothetical protein
MWINWNLRETESLISISEVWKSKVFGVGTCSCGCIIQGVFMSHISGLRFTKRKLYTTSNFYQMCYFAVHLTQIFVFSFNM